MIIGIAGHQNLSDFNINWIKDSIFRVVTDRHFQKGVSNLAIGSDQLFCEVLIVLGIRYDAIIPCLNYESTFKTKISLQKYHSLLSKATNIKTLDFPSPTEEAFYAAGKSLVFESNLLLAIWDGKPSKGLGGTADIVSFAQSLGKEIYHINPKIMTTKSL